MSYYSKSGDKPLVSIQCITYNHDKYIRGALEGFIMQQTDFPFIVIVHDDASTNGAQDIIREYERKYPDIIKPIYEIENQYSKQDGSLSRIVKNALYSTGAKYYAFCEGDDYWTDPKKLQKQVDLMENNPQCGMCYTRAISCYSEDFSIKKEWGGSYTKYGQLLVRGNVVPTLTSLIRADIYKQYHTEIEPESKGWRMGDYPMWLYVAVHSEILFINEATGVYRELMESASHTENAQRWMQFQQSYRDIKRFFLERYPIDNVSEEDLNMALFRQVLRRRTMKSPELRKEASQVLSTIESLPMVKKNIYKLLNDNKLCNGLLSLNYWLYDKCKTLKALK